MIFFFKVLFCSALILAVIATAYSAAVPDAKPQRKPQYAAAPVVAAGPPLAALQGKGPRLSMFAQP